MPKKPSFLKRDLDARAHSEAYRLQFRLPGIEKLDGSIDATLWTPYNKRYVWGKIYLSQNYMCFESRVNIYIKYDISIKKHYKTGYNIYLLYIIYLHYLSR